MIEGWFKRGSIPVGHPHELKVRAAVAHLPKPGPGLLIEHRFKIAGDSPLPFTGIIDFVNVREADTVSIVDHKTTASLARQTDKDLAADPQMLTYSEWAFRSYPDRQVKVAHNTISTTHKARVLPIVYTDIPRDAAGEHWEAQKQPVRDMLALAGAPPADWNDVPCNTNACWDYGGCDFLPLCSIKTPLIGVPPMSYDEKVANGLLAKLEALKLEQEANAPPPLLPPDAPSRETPAVPEKPGRKTRTKEAGKLTVHKLDVCTTESLNEFGEDGLELLTLYDSVMSVFQQAKKKRWEYYVDPTLESVTEEFLNEKTGAGWQFVGFYDGLTAVFKRPL